MSSPILTPALARVRSSSRLIPPQRHHQRVLLITSKKKDKGEREYHPYHVTLITPPPRNLGIHCLPPNMQCGETVTVKGEAYVVSGVTYRYRLRRGKYEQGEKRLDVLSSGRYLVNLFFDNLYKKS